MARSYLVYCCALTFAFLASPLSAAEPAAASASPAATAALPKPAPKPAPNPTPNIVSYGRNAAQRRIDSVLDRPLTSPLEFIETPLNQMTEVIAETYDIPIVFDVDALQEINFSPETEVTVQIGNINLKSALRLMLRNASNDKVTYILDNEVLLITTQEVAENHLETRIYPVHKLVAAIQSGQPPAATADEEIDSPDEISELADALILTVSPQTWRRNGTGAGDVQKIGDKYLVVLQTQAVHEEIESFLKQLAAALVGEQQTTTAASRK